MHYYSIVTEDSSTSLAKPAPPWIFFTIYNSQVWSLYWEGSSLTILDLFNIIIRCLPLKVLLSTPWLYVTLPRSSLACLEERAFRKKAGFCPRLHAFFTTNYYYHLLLAYYETILCYKSIDNILWNAAFIHNLFLYDDDG